MSLSAEIDIAVIRCRRLTAVVTVGLLSLEALVTMGRPRVRLLLLLLMVVAVTLVIPPAVFWFAEEGLGLLLSWC